MTRRSALVIAGAMCAMAPLLTAGCAARGQDYARPSMPVPAQYRFVEPAQADALADVRWWQVFGDEPLQALIREAIANNLDLRAAVARVERARALAGVARSRLYPQIDGTADYNLQHRSGPDLDDDKPKHAPNRGKKAPDQGSVQNNAIYGFDLSWEIDLFGRLRREEEAAIAVMYANEQARRGVLVTLVGDIASNYFRLRQLDRQLAISHETLRVNDETVTYFQNRLDGGVSNRLEVDRMGANRATTAATIPDLEREIAVVEDLLSLLAGRAPGPIVRSPADPPLQAPAIPAGLPVSLLERRPDIGEAEQLLVAANADIGAAKALFFPAINLTGFLGGVSGDLVSLLGGAGGVWTLGAGLVQPVFNAGRLKRNLEAAQATYDEALARYQQSALNGYREVADALITIQKLAGRRLEQEKSVALLTDAADLSRARYDSGLASYIEILTADERLFEQQLLLAATEGAELRARTDLYRALGGGWQP
jgi:multidrug efflux system outer membrane protein